ncbi:phenylacetate--CoA ligase [candidate division KSB1 bacterium]|nr:phenylacetate--CoA ligase [candidate division KSB1 bacterium]
MPREALIKLQKQRLLSILEHAYSNVPFYKAVFDENKISHKDINSLDDLKELPFTTKADMQASYPYNMFAIPLDKVVRIHSSSGTTGKPTVVGYSRKDLDNWSELIARLLTAGGVTQKDIVQIAFGYGLFTGGFGLHYGVEKIGAAVVPVSSGNTERQLMIMRDFKTTALVCTPSYALYLAEAINEANISPDDLYLRVGMFGAEPWTEGMRSEIERRLGISATDNYGLSEVMGPGVSMECQCKHGMHINEDHFIAEIINPDTGEVLPHGSVGELVLTTLTKEAIPVIRYRTRDIASLIEEQCECGRTFTRMTKPQGRTDDMLIIRGVNVFPSQIETVLIEMEETDPHYQLVVSREGALDELEIRVEVNEAFFSDEMRQMREIEEKIRQKIRDALGVSAKLKLVEPKSIERSTGKAKRVIDLRKKN